MHLAGFTVLGARNKAMLLNVLIGFFCRARLPSDDACSH
jgi:hypothetical protein